MKMESKEKFKHVKSEIKKLTILRRNDAISSLELEKLHELSDLLAMSEKPPIKIEDFCIGFEYEEHIVDPERYLNRGLIWVKKIYSLDSPRLHKMLDLINKEKVRHIQLVQIELEILNASYWEHFKYAKELAGFLPLKHPKRLRAEEELNRMIDRIHELQNNIK